MRLILLTVLVALAAGFLTGGTLREFPTVKTRWWGLAFVGVAMQFVTGGGTLETVLLLGSFVVLLAFVGANIRAPGFVLVMLGLALNGAVITANQGMPVTRHALVASGQANTLTELATNGDGQKHFLADDDTPLLPLGDAIPLGSPVGQAISIGDIFVHLGIGWFIVMAMRRRDPSPALEPGTAEV
jgi:lysylphosphatidylglycerol synthetase-like protein (DUF2156 family)